MDTQNASRQAAIVRGTESLVFPVESPVPSEDALRAQASQPLRFFLKPGGVLCLVGLSCMIWPGGGEWLTVTGFMLLIGSFTCGFVGWICWRTNRERLRSQDPPDLVSIHPDHVEWRLTRDPDELPVAWENAEKEPVYATLAFRWDQIRNKPRKAEQEFDIELGYPQGGGRYVREHVQFTLDIEGVQVPFQLGMDMYPYKARHSQSLPIQNPGWLRYAWLAALIKARPDLTISPDVYEFLCVDPATLALDPKPLARTNKIVFISALIMVVVTFALIPVLRMESWPMWGILVFVLFDILLLIPIMLLVSWIIPEPSPPGPGRSATSNTRAR